jgi:hypothetical protein
MSGFRLKPPSPIGRKCAKASSVSSGGAVNNPQQRQPLPVRLAGTPIKREYLRKLQEQGGIRWALDRLAAGETLTSIAKTAGVSVSFTHYWLFAQPGGRAAVHLARLQAVESAAHDALLKAESKLKAAGRGASDAMMWLQSRGGFRKVAESESSANPHIPSAYVSERQREMGRLHLEAALKRAVGRERLGRSEDVALEPGPDPTDALLY